MSCQAFLRSTARTNKKEVASGLLLQWLAIRLGLAHHRRMNTYSEGLRKKIAEAKERGVPTVEVARTFGVSLSSVKR